MKSKIATKASLAFILNQDFSKVLLIKKQKPVEHFGLLNGLGGKQEADESSIECVIREVEEECGLVIPKMEWHSVGHISWEDWSVSIWTTSTQEVKVNHLKDVEWYPVSPLPKIVIENLKWLIPLSIDVNRTVKMGSKSRVHVDIRYT